MEASFTVAVIAVLVGGTILWVWALADVLGHPPAASYRRGSQLTWTVVIALTHTFGAALYLAFGRRRPMQSGAGR